MRMLEKELKGVENEKEEIKWFLLTDDIDCIENPEESTEKS